MKKLYTLALALSFTSLSFAQKVIDIETTVISPAPGTTITINQSTPFQVSFKNKGVGAIAPADTLYFAFTGSSSTFFITGKTKAMNDTILLNTSLTFNSGTNGPLNFCVASIVLNGLTILDNDTTNNRDCNNVTIAGGTTGIVDAIMGDNSVRQQLNLYPNPVSQTVNFDFTATNNGEVTAHVFDISGREVVKHNFGKAYNGKKDFSLDVSNLNTGMYFVEIRQNNTRAVGKLNKQ